MNPEQHAESNTQGNPFMRKWIIESQTRGPTTNRHTPFVPHSLTSDGWREFAWTSTVEMKTKHATRKIVEEAIIQMKITDNLMKNKNTVATQPNKDD